ncbi:UNVERIFIED_CONTAM: Piriformospora indica-insensitive protein 2 [Sesamum angustifolium]|uniref:Piriformospora indica-insensitive protein 2 n=1 Tax=Sesamum angustifolium TaxID=2727405 RepID=A0AAW2RKI7_9LAMI
MKKLKYLSFSILVLCIFYLSAPCNGDDESLAAPMKRTEQQALYSAIQGFVGNGGMVQIFIQILVVGHLYSIVSRLNKDLLLMFLSIGVSCDLFDGFWYVTDLSIGPVHDNSLSCAQNVEFSSHLFALRHLRSLSFFNCFVSPRQRPISIPSTNWEVLAESLESLEFRSNPGLTGEIPVAFGLLRNLQSIVLMENGLTGELPESIGNLINLRRLNLAANSFKGRIPDSFGGLNRLLILDMSRNSLSGFLPMTFGGLNSLLKLDLSNNQLQGKIPLEFRNLKDLTLLDLSNRLSGALTQSLQELSSLQELVLSNNPTGGEIMSLEWRNMRALIALDLSNMSLTGEIPESIAELKGLRFLGLNDNQLTGKIPQKLASLPNVSAIYLHGNNLTGELKFSDWFYGKMGRRFGAWGNPNLCYPIGLVRTGYAPFGVKQCEEKVMKYETHLDSKNSDNHDSTSTASLGFKGCGLNRLGSHDFK